MPGRALLLGSWAADFEELEAKFGGSQIESFRLAVEVQRGLLNLNNSMLRYAMLRDSREWDQFERASTELKNWIDQHDPSVNSKSSLTATLTPLLEREVRRDLTSAPTAYSA